MFMSEGSGGSMSHGIFCLLPFAAVAAQPLYAPPSHSVASLPSLDTLRVSCRSGRRGRALVVPVLSITVANIMSLLSLLVSYISGIVSATTYGPDTATKGGELLLLDGL
jgi:hypothetical protein